MPAIRSIRSARPRSRWRPRYCGAEKRLGPDTRFTHVQLEEPAKADVLGWKPNCRGFRGAPPQPCSTARPARPMSPRSTSDRRRVTAWREHPTRAHPYGQPPITIEEVFKVGDIVKADAGWRRAMKRRGPDRQGHRAGPGRSVLGRLLRPRGREGPPARQRRVLLAQGHQGQWLRAPDRGRGRAGRPDREQGRPPRRRARYHPDPEKIAQLRPRVDPADAQGRQAARCRAEGRPELYGRGLEGRLAELVVPRRLDGARGPRAASDRAFAMAGASGRSSTGPASPT